MHSNDSIIKSTSIFCWLLAFSTSLAAQSSITKGYTFDIQELSDATYPDNPDIGFRCTDYVFDYFGRGNIRCNEEGLTNLTFMASAKYADTIRFNQLPILHFIPTIPDCIKGKDDYLSHLAVVNQEWNRQQVQFSSVQFLSNNPDIVRVDIARNCLNAYLWEIIVYKSCEGKVQTFSHGWFNFPKPLYQALFEKANGIPFSSYAKALENWEAPESKTIKREILRTIGAPISVKYQDLSKQLYPVEGERLRKQKEIVCPSKFRNMSDLQTDATTFATFTPPGFYNRADPRKTELGRFVQLTDVSAYEVVSPNTAFSLTEMELWFEEKNGEQTTRLVLGGIDFSKIPALSSDKANDGWKNSMGFGNHSFYEDYETFNIKSTATSSYYAFLSDEYDAWLDSHQVGIDGPLLHFDDKVAGLLHIWLLSFERHALVGHYTVQFPVE